MGAFDGAPASGGALRAAERHGLDLSTHASTFFTPRLAESADLILTMTAGHLAHLDALGAGERATVLTAFAAEDGGDAPDGVPDPIGGPDEEYEQTFAVLEELVARALARLEPVVKP